MTNPISNKNIQICRICIFIWIRIKLFLPINTSHLYTAIFFFSSRSHPETHPPSKFHVNLYSSFCLILLTNKKDQWTQMRRWRRFFHCFWYDYMQETESF